LITCDVLGYCPTSNNGLGNQMFCIATALGLAKENNDKAVFPDLNFHPYDFYGNSIFHKLNKSAFDKKFVKNRYTEKSYTSTIYNKIEYKEDLCIYGYFQSYKYFHDYEEHIQDMFSLPDFYTDSIDKKYEYLYKKNAVALHFRRKDYLKFENLYCQLEESYYLNALNKIGEYDTLVLFSDDINWVKNNTDFLGSTEKIYIEGELDVVDMYLMSKIKNNIIANSTFSWWAAYLNKNKDKKVVSPWCWFGPKRVSSNKKETADLIPESWIRI